MTQTATKRLHIVEGTVWKDAVIALLESRSPYRPWRCGFGEAHDGDRVAIVLNTDPPSILCALGRIGIDGRSDRAVVEWSDRAPGVVDLATLTAVVDFPHDQNPREVWQLRGDAAVKMELALDECRYRSDVSMRLGHSDVAAARILLHSGGRCTGCGEGIDLTWKDARDVAYIRTIDAPSREASEVLIQDTRGWASYIDWPFRPTSWLLEELPADWPRGVVSASRHAHGRRWIYQRARLSLLTASQVSQVWRGAYPTCTVWPPIDVRHSAMARHARMLPDTR